MSLKPELVEVVYKGFVTLEHWRVPGIKHLHVVIRCTDSIAGVLYDAVNDRLLFIDEPHVAAITEDNPEGRLMTPFAGRFDRNLSPKQLLIAEAREEVGAVLTEDDVVMLNHGTSMVLSIGIITERTYLCFAEITSTQLLGKDEDIRGVPEEGEQIKRVWISAKDLEQVVCEDLRVFALIQHVRLMRLERKIVHLNSVIDHSCECEENHASDPHDPFYPEGDDDDVDGEEHGSNM